MKYDDEIAQIRQANKKQRFEAFISEENDFTALQKKKIAKTSLFDQLTRAVTLEKNNYIS